MTAAAKLGPDHYRYFDTIGPEGLEVHCETYVVIGETDQCWYIADAHTAELHSRGQLQVWAAEQVKRRRKRVLKEGGNWGRRFAYTDKARALRSYKIRKSRQLGHAKTAMERAKAALDYFGDLTVTNEAPVAKTLIIPNEHIQGLGWGDC